MSVSQLRKSDCLIKFSLDIFLDLWYTGCVNSDGCHSVSGSGIGIVPTGDRVIPLSIEVIRSRCAIPSTPSSLFFEDERFEND